MKLKSDSLIEDLLFLDLFLFIAIAIYYSRLMNLSVLIPIAIVFGAYGLLKPKKWKAITKGEMCNQCHYDLYGLEHPSKCPECGKRLNQIQPSLRQHFQPVATVAFFDVDLAAVDIAECFGVDDVVGFAGGDELALFH